MNPDDIKAVTLPRTVEELDRMIALRERAAFVAAWGEAEHGTPCVTARHVVEAEARHRYPIRRKVPRVVTGPGWKASVIHCIGGPHVEIRREERSQEYAGRRLDADDIKKLAGLLADPFEEIEE